MKIFQTLAYNLCSTQDINGVSRGGGNINPVGLDPERRALILWLRSVMRHQIKMFLIVHASGMVNAHTQSKGVHISTDRWQHFFATKKGWGGAKWGWGGSHIV